MRSVVIMVVEHGETTDPLVEFLDKADLYIKGANVESYDFRVDVGENFKLGKNLV